VIAAPKGSGRVELNGPPARHFQAGDKIIVLGEAWLEPSELEDLDPKIVIVEGDDGAKKLTDRNRKFRLLAHSKVRNSPRKKR
jgi:aspartate 1-decarboxylase